MFYQHCNANIQNHHNIRYYENFSFQTHLHRDYELVFLLSGSLDVTVDSFHEVLHAPCCLLILSDQTHAYRCAGPSAVLIHVFSADVVSSFHKKAAGKAGDSPVFPLPKALWDHVLDLLTVHKDYGEFTLKGCLYQILEHYLRHVSLHERTASQTTLLPAIFAYITSHYTEKITLEDVAIACGYSAHYISRVFSDAVGVDFRKFINNYRLDHARTLLRETDMSVTEVALASGFGCVRSFNRAYAQAFHDVPHRRSPDESPVFRYVPGGHYEGDITLFGYEPQRDGLHLELYDSTRNETITKQQETES